ncbi:tetratricopeptide repeat protein [Elusimicrobiota bacterium]
MFTPDLNTVKKYIEEKKWDLAEKELLSLLQSEPDNFEAGFELGKLYHLTGDHKRATSQLEKVLAVNPEDMNALDLLAKSYTKTAANEKTVNIHKKILSIKPGDARIHFELGKTYFILAEFKTALTELTVARKLDPDNKYTRMLLAKVFCRLKKYDLAEKEIDEAARLGYSNSNDMHKELGNIYFGQRRYKNAEAEFKEALKYDTSNTDILFQLGVIYEEFKDYHSAIKNYEMAQLKGSDTYDINIRMSRIYRFFGENEKALEQLRKCGINESDITDNIILNEIEITDGKTVLKSKPRSLIAVLTEKCNLQCTMCDIWKGSWEISAPTVKQIIELMPYLQRLLWTGGEAFLSPYFSELFEEACKYPYLKQSLITNGLLINETWVRKFIDNDIYLIFSIDGFSKNSYEKIRKGAKFKDLIGKLELYNKYRAYSRNINKPQSKLNMVLMHENLKELENVMEFVIKYKFDCLQIMQLCDRIDPMYKDPGIRKYITDQIKIIFQKAAKQGITVHSLLPLTEMNTPDEMEITTEPDGMCHWPWQQLYINYGGNVTVNGLCEDLVLGNTGDSTLTELWNNEIILHLRRSILERETCKYSLGQLDRCRTAIVSKEKFGLDF